MSQCVAELRVTVECLQGMQMLTKLQILFSLVDLTNNKRLTVSEVELLLQALHQHCATIGYTVPAAQVKSSRCVATGGVAAGDVAAGGVTVLSWVMVWVVQW